MESVSMLFVICIALIIIIVFKVLFKSNDNNIEYCYHEGIKTLIIRDELECILALKKLLTYSPEIVGFDLEWKSNKIREEEECKVCLMQIAFDNKLIILIRLHLFDNIPMELISFLNDVEILKCGVGIYGDKKKLQNDYKIEMFGCIDLNDIYLNINCNHCSYFGLETFTKSLLNKQMKYKHNINHSKWECNKLRKQQIDYAANDALIGYQIFMAIFNERSNINSDILQFCFGKIDTNLLSTKSFSKLNNKNKNKQKNKKCKLNNYKKNGKTVECICNNKMVLVEIKQCIKDKNCRVQNGSKYIVCNKCEQVQKNENIKVYQCKHRKSIFCENGYILCIQCSLKPKEEHYEYKILDIDGELLHCCSLRMFTLFRASKNWVQRLDKFTIKMKVDINCINIDNYNKNYFRHISWITPSNCYVCDDNENNEILPYKIIPKWFVVNILGYRVPLCPICRSKYNKLQILFCHELCEKYLMKTDKTYQLIYDTKNIKQYIDYIQYEEKRKTLNVETQNKYIRYIFEFYYKNMDNSSIHHYINMDDIIIRDCDFNNEIGIDWWKNKRDYKTIIIRYIIFKICTSFQRKKFNHYMKQILNQYYKDKPLRFAELLRGHFMESMNPKNYNKKYPSFEVLYVEDLRNGPVGDNDELFHPNHQTFKPKSSSFVAFNDDKK